MPALLGDQAFVHALPALSNPYWRGMRARAACQLDAALAEAAEAGALLLIEIWVPSGTAARDLPRLVARCRRACAPPGPGEAVAAVLR